MTQKKTIQPQITHDHEGHAHVNCPGLAPCRLCRIEVDHLSVSAGHQQLLHDVNLHIHCGELTALIGANGAGKDDAHPARCSVRWNIRASSAT